MASVRAANENDIPHRRKHADLDAVASKAVASLLSSPSSSFSFSAAAAALRLRLEAGQLGERRVELRGDEAELVTLTSQLICITSKPGIIY